MVRRRAASITRKKDKIERETSGSAMKEDSVLHWRDAMDGLLR